MGMFDTAIVEGRRYQFKSYIGDYSPSLRCVHLSERLYGFPRIPSYETCGIDDDLNYCVLQFRYGVLAGCIRPIPHNYVYAPLPEPRNLRKRKRKSLALAMERERREREFECTTLGPIISEHTQMKRRSPGIMSTLLAERSVSGNYMRVNGKWVRSTPY